MEIPIWSTRRRNWFKKHINFILGGKLCFGKLADYTAVWSRGTPIHVHSIFQYLWNLTVIPPRSLPRPPPHAEPAPDVPSHALYLSMQDPTELKKKRRIWRTNTCRHGTEYLSSTDDRYTFISISSFFSLDGKEGVCNSKIKSSI